MNTSTASYSEDEGRWDAVCARDAGRDGEFVFAVRTTGIFCRPSCPARRPLRRNVDFFRSPLAAEVAGFRACRRCRPLENSDPHLEAVRLACRLIEESETQPRMPQLAQATGLSASHLQRQFKRLLGMTPRQYGQALRVQRLQQGLANGQPVTDAIYEAGYGAGSRVYESAHRTLGMTPGNYRRGGHGQRIAWATATTSLGPLLVAATDRGVCAIEFGDNESELKQSLHRRFPNATIADDNNRLGGWLQQVVGHLEMPRAALDLPLDIQGTAFQQRVWRALQEIPPGQTASYGKIAEQIGQPGAQRAVAGACAANPVALAVPCHRVIRSDGGAGGYRWGAKRKRELLQRESEASKEA